MRMKVVALLSAILIVPQLVRAQAVHVRQSSTEAAVFEVRDSTVSIRKELSPLASVVTMATPRGDVLRLAIGPTGVIAETGDRTSTAVAGQPMSAESVMATLRSSRAANAARTLLTRLTLDPKTPAGNVMLLTRALLEASQNEGLSALSHQQWARATATAATMEEAEGPGDCWAEYSRYAVEVWDDYMSCLTEVRWYDLFGEYRCEAVYVLRAELAFMWLINCSGPFPFKG